MNKATWELWPDYQGSVLDGLHCPMCQRVIVPVRLLYTDETSRKVQYYGYAPTETYDVICPHCQYRNMITVPAGTLTVNPLAEYTMELADRVDELSAKVAQLTDELHKLSECKHTPRPQTVEPTHDDTGLSDKYRYLL